MIIDQLSPTVTDNLTDEVPVEQGQLTFKTTWQKILNLFKSNLSASDIPTSNGNVQSDIGDLDLTTTATDLTDAINELDADLDNKQATLVSGTNIKTLNNESLLGSGNIEIQGGGGALLITNIPCSATTGDFVNYITAKFNYEWAVVSMEFSKPSAITTDVFWNTMGFSSSDYPTAIGKLVLNGTCTDATCTVNVILVHLEEGW